MDQGWGHDGSTTAELLDRITPAILGRDVEECPAAAEAFDDEKMSVWHPAPGAVVVLPEGFTPTYSYPALIWLAGPNVSECTAQPWLEQISSRNFVGVGLRAELYQPVTRRSAGALQPALSRFDSLMRCVDKWIQLHPRRRYVAGAGAAASVAVDWLLARPQWFEGAVAIDVPRGATAAHRASQPLLERRRLLWVDSTGSAVAREDDAELLALQYLGLKLTRYAPAGGESTSAIADRINRWLLEKIPTAVLD